MSYEDVATALMVKITLKSIEDGTTEKSVYLTNRMFPNSYQYRPLLRSFSGAGLGVGQNGLPVVNNATFVIADYFKSWSANKRFSDELTRWSMHEQTIELFYTKASISALTFDDVYLEVDSVNWLPYFKGIIKRYSKSFDDEEDPITIQAQSLGLPERVITREITTDIEGGADSSAIGATIPYSLGEETAQIIAVQAEVSTEPYFWHGIEQGGPRLTNALTTPGSTYYAQDDEGNYRHITLGNGSSSALTGGTYPTAQGLTERAYSLQDSTWIDNEVSCYVTYGGRWRFRGLNNGSTPSGHIEFTLYELSDTSAAAVPVRVVAKAVVAKVDYYTQLQGASDFWVDFSWDRAVVLKQDGNEPQRPGYAVSMRLSAYSGVSTTDFVDGGYTGTGTITAWTRTANGQWSSPASISQTAVWNIYNYDRDAVYSPGGTDDDQYDSEGYRLRGRHFTTETAGTNQTHPELRLNLLVTNEGRRDQSSRFALMTAYGESSIADTRRPQHVAAALTADYEGSGSWVQNSDWEFTTFSQQYIDLFSAGNHEFYRQVSGAFETRTSLRDALAALCAETACKIVQRSDTGKLTLCPWGYERDVTAVLQDDQIEVLGFEILDTTSVINRIKLYYGKEYVNLKVLKGLVEDNAAGYAGEIDYSADDSSYLTFLSGKSVSLYGKKEVQEYELNLLADSTSADTYADYLLRTYDHPHMVVKIAVPFWETRDLELLDVVEVISPKLPAYGGTSPNAELPHTLDTREPIQLNPSGYWKQAQRYRCEIVNKDLSWAEPNEPVHILDLRIINPRHENDPT